MLKIDELEIFKIINEEVEEIPENVTINGDVNISINIEEKQRLNARQKRAKISAPWKNNIKLRDKNQCQCCKEVFENHLEIHHIFPFSRYPSLSKDDGNGIALCQKCHSKYHNMYKGKENAVTFAQFLRDYGKR